MSMMSDLSMEDAEWMTKHHAVLLCSELIHHYDLTVEDLFESESFNLKLFEALMDEGLEDHEIYRRTVEQLFQAVPENIS